MLSCIFPEENVPIAATFVPPWQFSRPDQDPIKFLKSASESGGWRRWRWSIDNAVWMSDEAAAGQHLAWRLSGASWDEVTSEVVAALEQLAQRLGADRSYVTVYHDDGTFENLFEWTASGVLPQLPVIQRLRSDDFAHTSELARHGEVFVAAAISELPESAAAEQRSFSSFGVAAVLQVPIVVDGEGIGLVGINHFAPVDGWADDEVAAVGEIGRAIGTALVRARAAVATDRAEEAQADARRARNELLAHVSHELRTPLHGLLGYSELLRLELRDESHRHALAQIETSGRRLLAMVDDLIDLAESSGDGVTDVAVAPVVAFAVAGLAPVAAQRGVALLTDRSLAGAVVRGEAGRVRQVVYCAISGALQAIERGGAIVVAVGTTAAEAATITLSVHAERLVVRPDLVMPLARVLVEGHGRIDLRERIDGVDVEIAFGHRRSNAP